MQLPATVSSSTGVDITETVDVARFEPAVSRLLDCARQPASSSHGYWRNYVRLERIYNAVEVCLPVLLS